MDVQELGPGRYLVKSQSSDGYYAVTDGICECKGYEHRQKCKHVTRLIDLGKLSPKHVEGYFKNQQHPPIKVASPDHDPGRYMFWVAAYDNLYLQQHADDFYKIGIVPKPYGLTIPYRINATFATITPDDVLFDLPAEDFVEGYRHQLNEYGVEKMGTFMANCRLQAHGRAVVFLTPGDAIGLPFSFANPRRVWATWWYERTKQVVPEMR